jgi:hypothetical protein
LTLFIESISEANPAVRFKFFNCFCFYSPVELLSALYKKKTKKQFSKLLLSSGLKNNILTLSVKRNDLCNTKEIIQDKIEHIHMNYGKNLKVCYKAPKSKCHVLR